MSTLTPLDELLTHVDRALKAVFVTPTPARPMPQPGPHHDPNMALSDSEQRTAAALMRVNHAGEVAAQALYHGQAAFARRPEVRTLLLQSAREEADHLAWYAGSFAIGAAAAAAGDGVSLGFVSETERQVEGHIDSHLQKLPEQDRRSRAVLEAMRADEIAHGATARAAGGVELPPPVQTAMRASAKVMTTTSYWI